MPHSVKGHSVIAIGYHGGDSKAAGTSRQAVRVDFLSIWEGVRMSEFGLRATDPARMDFKSDLKEEAATVSSNTSGYSMASSLQV